MKQEEIESDGPGPRRGLHGHVIGSNVARTGIAEAVGTFLLVLTVIGTAIAATLEKPSVGVPYGSLAVPLAGGLILIAVVAGLGPISGAHLNPAVTIGLAVNGRFPWRYVPPFVAAQFLGAVVAALAGWAIFGNKARYLASLGATLPAQGVSAGDVLVTEAFVTFLLVAVMVSVATNSRVPAALAAAAIGFALTAAILISGGAVNSARALGPMIVAGKLTDWWAYVLGPLAGSILAVGFYERVLRPAVPPT
jgi:MIP family channel proteins